MQDEFLKAILGQYETASANNSGGKSFDMSKYFSTYIPDDVNSGMKVIRLLPGKAGATPFTTIHIHNLKVDGQFRKFVCPNKEKNEPCPVCQAYEAIMAEGDAEQKKGAFKYKAKAAHVMKVIDRDNEAEGPKFWRVNHNSKKAGHYDKIIGLFKAYQQDLSNPETGRDIVLNIEKVAMNGKKIPTVTSVIARDSSPLSPDAESVKRWLANDETWEDVYSIKPYEYLNIIVRGGEPVWDKEKQKFVNKLEMENDDSSTNYGNDLEAELTMGGGATQAPTTPQPQATPQPQTQAPAPTSTPQPTQAPQAPVDEDEEEDDLPF
jgi:hypothetical protein